MSDAPDEFAALLERARRGETAAAQDLYVCVYEQLRGLARRYLRGAGHTLQPTALVHEAFLRMVRQPNEWQDRGHFVNVAATAMRQILVDQARRRAARKRGGDRAQVSLAELPAMGSKAVDLLALDRVLSRLAALSQRQARIVELRCFGGLTIDEIAKTLGTSGSLTEKEWRRARAWIRRELVGEPSPGDES